MLPRQSSSWWGWGTAPRRFTVWLQRGNIPEPPGGGSLSRDSSGRDELPPCARSDRTLRILLSPMQVPHGCILWRRQHESGRCGLREYGSASTARLLHPGRAGCPGLQVILGWRLARYSRRFCQPWGQVIECMLDKTSGTLRCPILMASKGCFSIPGCHINAVVM